MLALSNEEWAILVGIAIFIIGFLYTRAKRKQRLQKHRTRVAKYVYDIAMNAQNEAIVGATTNKKLAGTELNSIRSPLDFQDHMKVYVNSAIEDLTHNQIRSENEYLLIDEQARSTY